MKTKMMLVFFSIAALYTTALMARVISLKPTTQSQTNCSKKSAHIIFK
jgi:hypothetical protein